MNHASKIRTLVLTVMPSPYQRELFDAMAAHPGLDLRVLYYTAEAPDRQWGRPELPAYSRILPGRAVHWLTRCCCLNPSASRVIRNERPDVVIVGDYFTLTSQIVMRDLAQRGVPWIFWGERPGMRSRSWLGRAMRRLAQGPVLRDAYAVAGIGSRACEIYRRLVADRCPVFNIPYHCDLSPFFAAPRVWDRPDRHDPLCSGVRFLFSGQLIPRKGVDLLLQAFDSVSSTGTKPPRLVLLGDGPDRARYEAMTPPRLRSRVEFRGHVAPADLPRAYEDGDVFVLPSRHDGWGVVVNEAIAAGMPVIASDAVGAAHDLVEPGRNGTIVRANDAASLAAAMREFVDDPARIEVFGRRSREIAADWTVQRGAERWHEALRVVLTAARVAVPISEVAVA